MTGLICLAWFVNVNNKPLGLGFLFSLIFCFVQHKESFLISLFHFFLVRLLVCCFIGWKQDLIQWRESASLRPCLRRSVGVGP